MGTSRGTGSRRKTMLLAAVAPLAVVGFVAAALAANADPVVEHGSVSDQNACTAAFAPAVMLPSPATLPVQISTDASPQPQDGGPVTLSNTQLSVSIPAALLQTPVDLGLLADGNLIPTSASLTLAGSNTVEANRVSAGSAVGVLHVVGGVAQPLDVTMNMAGTTWTAVDSSSPIAFTEQSLHVDSSLPFNGF